MRGGVGDLHVGDVARSRPIVLRRRDGDVDQPTVPRPSGHPRGLGVLAPLAVGEQHLDGATHQFLVLGPADLPNQIHQPLVALLHHRLGDLVGHRGRRGARTDRVLERECGSEAGLPDHGQRVLEIRFGLPRESHDDVGGDRGVRDRRPDPLQDAEVPLGAVGAAHRPEDRVRARLQRHVQRGHHVRRLGHGGDHVVGERGRVRRSEPDALQTVDLAARAQQSAEGEPITELHPVGVDVLPQQSDLLDTLSHQHADLSQDVAGTAVGLPSPERRDDAEGAGVVAAHTDRHPRRIGRVAPRGQRGRKALERFDDLDLRLVLDASAFEQDRQRTEVVGAEDHIHPGGPGDDGVPVLLRHASADRDLHTGSGHLRRGEVTEVAVQPVVGVLPDRAGVEHHDVGLRVLSAAAVAGGLQDAGDPLGVMHVHLAAVGLHVIGAGRLSLAVAEQCHGRTPYPAPARRAQRASATARDSRTTVTLMLPG